MTESIKVRRDKSCTFIVTDQRIDRRVLDQANSLVKVGWKVYVIARSCSEGIARDDQSSYPNVTIVRADESNLGTVPQSIDVRAVTQASRELPYWFWNQYWKFGAYILRAALGYPASIFVAVDLTTLPVTAVLANFFNASLVYDSHELFIEQVSLHPTDRRTLENYEYWLAPLADRVVTINDSVAALLAQRLRINAPDVVLNCPSIELEPSAVNGARVLHEQLQLPTEKKILLFQGGLVREVRNIENLVAAMKLVKNSEVALVLMGPATPDFRKELEDSARADGTFGRSVFILDAISQRRLLEVTMSADVGIIPYPAVDLNTFYCTPNKLFEYLSVGIPILANDLPELTRFVTGNGVGWNAPMNSAESIATAIDSFFSLDLSLFKSRAKQLALQYTWEAQESYVQQIFSEVLQDRDNSWTIRRLLKLSEVNLRHGRNNVARQKIEQAKTLWQEMVRTSPTPQSPLHVEQVKDVMIAEPSNTISELATKALRHYTLTR